MIDPSHKKPIPKYPGMIGIVTSEAGAAVHDMLRILNKRYPLTKVRLFPVRVQGAEAPGEIAAAIVEFNTQSCRHSAAHVICGAAAQGNDEFTESRIKRSQNKLTHTLGLIEREYVDSIALDTLIERTLPIVLKELDPHSVYISAADMAAMNEPLEGEFDGIGVVFNMATDTVIVLNVISKGPSDKAGIKAGDRIVEINDSLVAGRKIPQNEIVKQLRGPRGTKVKLGIDRQHIDELVQVEVVREKCYALQNRLDKENK